MGYTLGSIFVYSLLLFFILRDLAKKNGWKSVVVTAAFLGFMILTTVSVLLYTGDDAAAVLILLFLVPITAFALSAHYISPSWQRVLIQMALLVVFLFTIFAASPFYRCPVDGGWYTHGKDATLWIYPEDEYTLCHVDEGAEYDTTCHNFKGGYHGLFAVPLSRK